LLTSERTEKVTALCREMIRARSCSGEEKQIADIMKAYSTAAGFDSAQTDRYGNCICRIKGNRPGPRLLFDGHMDTVPVPDPSVWKHDPFGAEIDGNRIYGRGTSDMKGALSAMMAAADFFLQDTKHDFAGEICISGIVHEECFEGVAAREVSRNVKPDYVIIGEASELNVKIGQRGRGELVVETFGVPAHSSNPQKGINAVYKMADVIERLKTLEPPVHPFLGKGIMELTDIRSSPYPGASVVPDYCRATYDRRLLKGETKESVLEPVRNVLAEMAEADPDFKAEVSFAKGQETCYTGETIGDERFFPGWLFDRNEPYVQAVLAELEKKGFHPEITKYDFCTNGSHYAGEAGIRTIGIGPSKENLAHTTDEYIELDQLTGAAECYYAVMEALTGIKDAAPKNGKEESYDGNNHERKLSLDRGGASERLGASC